MNNKFILIALFIFGLLLSFLSIETFAKADFVLPKVDFVSPKADFVLPKVDFVSPKADVFALEAGEILTPQNVTPQDIGYVKVGTVKVSGIEELAGYLDKLSRWSFGVFLSIAVIFVISAGYIYLTGAGDEEKIRNARKRIVWAMAAIAVALLAGSVVLLISNFLGVGGGQQGTDKLNPYPGGPYQTQNQYYQQTSHTCSQSDINQNWCCAGSSNAASDCCGGKKAGDSIICFR